MVAGMAHALSMEFCLRNVLYYGVACGTAATMQYGTSLCNAKDVDALYEDMQRGASANILSGKLKYLYW
jgi:6-phosphofructokinase 2